ncbi:hypothetical protein QI554_43305, partial [Yinghuangia seranimata]|nr:hypothetical protein [Yinghuangia seranimata]
GRGAGEPAAAVGGDGRLYVFVRDRGKGVSARVLAANGGGRDGGWGPWSALGGGEVVEGLAAVAGVGGRVDVFGTGRDAVHHWSQDSAGTVRVDASLPADRPVGPPTVARSADGRLTVVHREAGTGRVVALSERAPGGGWAEPFPVAGVQGPDAGAVAGFGPPAAGGAAPTGPVAAACTADGAAWVGTLDGTDGPGGPVLPPGGALPGPVTAGPAVAVDARGRIVVAGLGTDGVLSVAVSGEPPGQGAQPVGNSDIPWQTTRITE